MSDLVSIRVDGETRQFKEGTSVAAAIGTTRHSITGEPRAALCGMGICFECRCVIDGAPHVRSCLVLVREGMEVRTHA